MLFIVPKKDGGLRPIIDTFMKCVDAALVPLRLQGIRILNYIDDWLILAESESLAVRHRDVVLAHMKTLGLRLNAKKSVLSPSQRTTYLGVVWDSTMMQARLSPARIESILAAVKRVKEGRSLTVKQFQQLLGLMAAASNGNPLRMIKVTRRGLRALDMWRKPWFLSQGPVLGAPCQEADMGNLWSSPSRSLCHEGECTMSPLVLSSSSSSPGAGCYGTDVAEASSVRLSPDRSAPGSSGESTPGRGQPSTSSLVLAGPSMVLGPDISPRQLSMGDSRQERSPLTGGGHYPSPPPVAVEAVGVAPEGAQLIASGLSTEVVETILQSRAPSTRKLYTLKWKLFTSWCGERQQDPANCPVGTVLEVLQARFSTGLAHSTLKVYVTAISAYHAPLGGMPVGKDPLVVRFLRGVLRLRPPTRPRVPTWDLAVVLEALCRPPFEPIEEIPWVGDLQALSVAPSHLEFAPGMIKAFLYPRPGYVPKVPTNAPQPVVLQAFCPSPFREPDQQKLNCICPVRALDAYVHRAALWRKSEQLFVCYGPP
ncbi:Protein P [Labeo rohita]|uniref:ribonuclease H n=1 Tax=Labeo rohita TaxID=84645 RepID=A0ABQ8LYE5_LABRO|nr:Protein P [Labeo rohita]